MTRDVVSVAPSTSLKEVARLLAEHGISGVPVCDPDGTVLGVVTEADILRVEQGVVTELPRPIGWVMRLLHGPADDSVGQVASAAMSAPAITVRPTQRAAEAARLMVDHGINRLPVVAGSRLAGIVSRADLVRAFVRPDAELEEEIRDDVIFRTMVLLPEDFDLEVHEGNVRIRGEVRSAEDARILTRCVRRVPGVVEVHCDLAVRPTRSGRHAPAGTA